MSRRYTKLRTEEIRKKKSRELMHGKPKIKITPNITCNHCGEFSGWTNDELRFISGNHEIKCQNCGKPCIQSICKSKAIEIISE